MSWEPGICDIVQISALEFQDREYQLDLLDHNHTESRRIIHEVTPDIPLWTSVQVMGARYGPHAGYWFPRQRDGHRELTRLLNDVTDPKYQNIHPLSRIMLQCWESVSPVRRQSQYVLGDTDDEARGDLPQAQAAEDAREAIRKVGLQEVVPRRRLRSTPAGDSIPRVTTIGLHLPLLAKAVDGGLLGFVGEQILILVAVVVHGASRPASP